MTTINYRMKIQMKSLCTILLTLFYFATNAQVSLPALVSDGMVLQRDKKIPIWGWASAGEEITVEFKDKVYKTVADKNRRWALSLAESQAGGPYTMSVKGQKNVIRITDILIGDVWLCSGQSNMEFMMYKLADKYPDDIKNATNAQIRQFHVKQAFSFKSLDNVQGQWQFANPQTIGRFTAVGYYMVKALYDKYKVPMGIIHSSWGGTPAEAWTSEDGLKEFPKYLAKSNYFKDTANVLAVSRKDKAVKDAWYNNLNKIDKNYLKASLSENKGKNEWSVLTVPGFWENQGSPNVDGVVWARKEIEVPKSMTGEDAILDLGMIDDSDTTYFNGIKVGSTAIKYLQRKYTIPASLIKQGKNTITVRITDTDGQGGFIKDKKYRLLTKTGEINLSGDWEYKIGASVKALPVTSFTRLYCQPASLYQGMIAPLLPYALKGIAWYQGESNTGKAEEYTALLSSMILDWRGKFEQAELPFLIVQLANYMEVVPQPSDSKWAELREAQLKVEQTLPNTGLAVTIDVGETNDVHPLNKRDVGSRLALAAQKLAYKNDSIIYSGPIYKSMAIQDDKIVIDFAHVGAGLLAKDNPRLQQFAIAGEDRKFVWANAKIEGNRVVVWNDNIKKPVAVRYAWANNPEGCNLYNKEGLPASPFRTDYWQRQ